MTEDDRGAMRAGQVAAGGDALSARLPAPVRRLYFALAAVALPAACILALLRLGLVVEGMAPRFAIVDFRFFHTAAVAFGQGVSVYGEAYLALGQALYDASFEARFFYAPTILPLLSPLSLLPPEMASAAFMVADAVVTVGSLAGAAWLLHARLMAVDWRLAGAAMVVLGAAILTPSVTVLFLGNVKFLMLAGLVLWIAGALRGRLLAQAIGLTLLMMIPQLGLVLYLVALLTPAWRGGALGAAALSALLYVFAAWPHGLVEYAVAFVEAVSSYAVRPENDSARLIGLPFLLGHIGIGTGPLLTGALCLLGAGLTVALLPARRDPYATALLSVAIGIAVAPGHLTNALLLMPGLALVLTAGPVLPRLLLGLALLVLGSVEHALPGFGAAAPATEVLRSWIATAGLAAALAGLGLLAREIVPAGRVAVEGGRADAAT